MLHTGWTWLATLIPSIGLLWLFYMIMKHIFEGDRRERLAQAQWEAQADAVAPTPAHDAEQPPVAGS